MPEVVIVADDLSGAADCAVAFTSTGLNACVLFEDPGIGVDADVIAIDAATRRMTADEAAQDTSRLFAVLPAGPLLYKKIDSMLRGHIGVEINAALAARRVIDRRTVVVMAPAFPAMGRTTAGGVQFVRGVPCGDIVQILETAGLRAKRIGMGEALRPGDFDALVCDAAEERDLNHIAQEALTLDVPVIWAGTAGLARHLPGAAGLRRDETIHARGSEIIKPILFVVGSASNCSIEQAKVLRTVLGNDKLAMIDASDATAPEDPNLCVALARSFAPRFAEFGALVLTGGETARAVLQELGVTGLRLIEEIEPGVPLSVSMGSVEIPVITKAGAFGDRETLIRCRRALRPNG